MAAAATTFIYLFLKFFSRHRREKERKREGELRNLFKDLNSA
jgi:hypothetical protein